MTSKPFFYYYRSKNILLIFLSLITLPISTTLVVLSLIITKLLPRSAQRNAQHDDIPKTILVTGVSMTKGLTLCRLLARNTPHRIIGADIESIPFTSPGRYSRALSKFVPLTPPNGKDTEPYLISLLAIIIEEKIDLWIPCSSVTSAVDDGVAAHLASAKLGFDFRAIHFSPEVVEKLNNKDTFISYVASLGLSVPESHRCTSASDVLTSMLFRQSNGERAIRDKKFILKPIGVNDKARGDMTLLPLDTSGATAAHIVRLRVSKENPYQLQQYIPGEEYCTHALVIGGVVKAFTACPSSELLMHYRTLSPSSSLFQKMLKFTERVAQDGGEGFTGHIAFDFLVQGEGENQKLYPIECNPRVHTAVVLFSDTPEMADAYLDVFPNRKKREGPIFPRTPCYGYYWVGHDLVTLLLMSLLQMVFGGGSLWDVKEKGIAFLQHLLFWKEGSFAVWDPVPFWVLYHVYWPAQFLRCLIMGQQWSR
jgi:catechol O-methyltransferase